MSIYLEICSLFFYGKAVDYVGFISDVDGYQLLFCPCFQPLQSSLPSSRWHTFLRAPDHQVIRIGGTMYPFWGIIQSIIHADDEECGYTTPPCGTPSFYVFFLLKRLLVWTQVYLFVRY